jgi:NADH-quinone oxidoreductase subunit F
VIQENKILLARQGKENSQSIETYLADGGYEALKKALTEMTPEQVVDEVDTSKLRGRGGAGFPTGRKWRFLPDNDQPRYLCVNADESEPGTCKDRQIMEDDPHLLIEGTLLCCYAIKSERAYIYIRGEYPQSIHTIEKAIEEAREKGFIGKDILGKGFDCEVNVQVGAGAYICGEETALLESLEGKRGYPRLKPPFPAVQGLWGCPTIINNVETVAFVPSIVTNGGEWYAGIGTPESTGTRLVCMSGCLEKPGVFEVDSGTNLLGIIDDLCGGVWKGRKLKAVIPGGSSVPVLTADECDVGFDNESLQELGTFAGSAGVIVMDDHTCMVEALLNLQEFYAHESCGQCTPCREGVDWMRKLLRRLESGEGTENDIEVLDAVASNIIGNTICPLADGAVMPVQSFVRKFRDEFVAHVEQKGCPLKKGATAAT